MVGTLILVIKIFRLIAPTGLPLLISNLNPPDGLGIAQYLDRGIVPKRVTKQPAVEQTL